METKNKGKVESVDLLLKSVWLAVSKMYSEQASLHNSTAVQALTLLKIDPKEGTRSTNLGKNGDWAYFINENYQTSRR